MVGKRELSTGETFHSFYNTLCAFLLYLAKIDIAKSFFNRTCLSENHHGNNYSSDKIAVIEENSY